MKKLTRDRVVPIISASVSWLIFAMIGSGLASLPKFANSSSSRARRFLAGIEELIHQVLFNSDSPGQKMRDKNLGKPGLVTEHADDARFLQPHDHALRHRRDRRYAPWLAGQAPSREFVRARIATTASFP